MDNRSFLKCITITNSLLVRGMALLKKLQRPTLWIYLSLNWHIRLHADLSAIIFVKNPADYKTRTRIMSNTKSLPKFRM